MDKKILFKIFKRIKQRKTKNSWMTLLRDTFNMKIRTKINIPNRDNHHSSIKIKKITYQILGIISCSKTFFIQMVFRSSIHKFTIIRCQIINHKCNNNNHPLNSKVTNKLLIKQLTFTCLIYTKLQLKYPAKVQCKKAVHLF